MNPDVVEITQEDPKVVCDFCAKSTINSLEWGPMYQYEGVTVHYFCLLFSANLSQNGNDEDGILGFLPSDIRKEVRRGSKLKCKFCRKAHATIGCSKSTCPYSYHYPCGFEKDCSFLFIGNFESYCTKHREKTKVPLPQDEWDCPICYSQVEEHELLWPPCCKKRVFHKKCIMHMAKNAGIHFFKCPLCNDKDLFSEAMRKAGIYLPDRDAAWETEPNAFADQRQLHEHCDAPQCICPEGRDYSEATESKPWHSVRCGTCGAFAIHTKCGNLKNLSWRCPTCTKVLSGKRRLESSRIIRRNLDSGDESEDELDPTSFRQAALDQPHPSQIETDSEDSFSGIDSDSKNGNVQIGESPKKRKIQSLACAESVYRRFVVDSEETDSDSAEDDMEPILCKGTGTPSGKVFIRNEDNSPDSGYGLSCQSSNTAAVSAIEPGPNSGTHGRVRHASATSIFMQHFDRDKMIRSGPIHPLRGKTKFNSEEEPQIVHNPAESDNQQTEEVVKIGTDKIKRRISLRRTTEGNVNENPLAKVLTGYIKGPTCSGKGLNTNKMENGSSDIEVVKEINKKSTTTSAAVLALIKQSRFANSRKKSTIAAVKIGIDDDTYDEIESVQPSENRAFVADNLQPNPALPSSSNGKLDVSNFYLRAMKKLNSEGSAFYDQNSNKTEAERYGVSVINLDGHDTETRTILERQEL